VRPKQVVVNVVHSKGGWIKHRIPGVVRRGCALGGAICRRGGGGRNAAAAAAAVVAVAVAVAVVAGTCVMHA